MLSCMVVMCACTGLMYVMHGGFIVITGYSSEARVHSNTNLVLCHSPLMFTEYVLDLISTLTHVAVVFLQRLAMRIPC